MSQRTHWPQLTKLLETNASTIQSAGCEGSRISWKATEEGRPHLLMTQQWAPSPHSHPTLPQPPQLPERFSLLLPLTPSHSCLSGSSYDAVIVCRPKKTAVQRDGQQQGERVNHQLQARRDPGTTLLILQRSLMVPPAQPSDTATKIGTRRPLSFHDPGIPGFLEPETVPALLAASSGRQVWIRPQVWILAFHILLVQCQASPPCPLLQFSEE